MFIAVVCALVFVVGVLIWALASNAKVAEIGRAMLWVGLFWTVGVLAHHVVKLF
jgi:hypothetical protein